jgi:hypothetical protein
MQKLPDLPHAGTFASGGGPFPSSESSESISAHSVPRIRDDRYFKEFQSARSAPTHLGEPSDFEAKAPK